MPNTDINKLYSLPATMPSFEAVKDTLAPYIAVFNIRYNNEGFTLGLENTPLNTVIAHNIRNIIEEQDCIYIAMPHIIYVLHKDTGKVEINIAQL